MEIDRAGKFDVDRANEAAIPQKFWAVCKKVKMSRTEIIYTHRTWFLDLRERELN